MIVLYNMATDKNDHDDIETMIFSSVTLYVAIAFLFIMWNRDIFSDSLFYLNHFRSGLELDYLEVGYNFYVAIMHNLVSEKVFLISFSIILIISLVYLHKKINKNHSYLLPALIILSPTFVAFSTTGYRQSLSMSISMVALFYLFNRKVFHFIITIYVATLFHTSSYIYIPLLVILLRGIKTDKFVFVWFISIVIGLIGIKGLFPAYIIDNMMSDYQHYFSDSFGTKSKSGIRLDYIVYSSLPIFLYYYINKVDVASVAFEFMIRVYIVLNVIANLFSFIPYSDRVYAYSWIFIPLIFSLTRSRIVLISMLVFSMSIFLFYNIKWIQS